MYICFNRKKNSLSVAVKFDEQVMQAYGKYSALKLLVSTSLKLCRHMENYQH